MGLFAARSGALLAYALCAGLGACHQGLEDGLADASMGGEPDAATSPDLASPDFGTTDAAEKDAAEDAASNDLAQAVDASSIDGSLVVAAPGTTPQTILVTHGLQLSIFALDGTLLHTAPVPAGHYESGEGLRGVVEDASGRVHVFAGTFNPRLATYDNGTWSSRAMGVWTPNVVHYRHLAAFGNVVLTTGFNVKLWRYDADSQASSTIAGDDSVDIIKGGDGKLYVVDEYDDTIELDPATYAKVRTLPISPSPDLIGASGAGTMYGVWTQDGEVFTFPANGSAVTHSAQLGINNIQDIDIAADGTVILCGGGKLVITNTAFTNVVVKSLSFSTAFCSFGYVPRP